MKKRVGHYGFISRIQNRQFQRLFFKNWLQVFLGIVLPLILCVSIVWYHSKKSLLNEIDTSAMRSTSNAMATMDVLLDEIHSVLERQMSNGDITSFFRMVRVEPQKYDYISIVRAVQDILYVNYRENLYYSVDAYSPVGNYIVSAPHKAQAYYYFSDKDLINTFYTYLEKEPDQMLFALPRTVGSVSGKTEKRVISFYWAATVDSAEKAFSSISVDADKFINYITDNHERVQGSYLIVDKNDQVVLDTAGQLNDQYIELPKGDGITAITTQINGQLMRVISLPMNRFGWTCVQMVPMEEYERITNQQQRLVMMTLITALVVAVALSYGITCRLFRPVDAILRLLENPSDQLRVGDEDGEIQYMLVSMLEVFQKNLTLEKEMLERVATLRRVRAKALQEQMTPHFLNNVLQAINWTAIEETGKEDSVTSKSLILLADILCTGKTHKTNITTVAEEIAYTKKFVELECLRYGPNIHCHYEIDPAAEQMPIPCISLQTLVENSISHGLQPRRASGNIYISIKVLGENGLHIRVEDDGVGFEEQKIKEIFELLQEEYIYVGEHLGIINLFQRFRLIYGEKCEFDIRNREEGGACVEIKVPMLTEDWIQRANK